MSQTVGQTKLAYSRVWHQIDVGSDSRPLGRIATQIAIILMGKHKPIWDPSSAAPRRSIASLSLHFTDDTSLADCGDYVVAVGCHDIHTTGKKRFQKKYYTHTTRPGSLKEITMDRMFAKWGGAEVLRKAVSGMLPKNRLRAKRLARLKAFEGPAHPYKENLIKVAGRPKISELAQVKSAFVEAQGST
ncbi:MAG: 54S ribosomal protein L23, mitochondrial [Sclerophora amabilis]|nr:MAG: 54S ribosomal protein L23, mitochondrial [Sclerophora amabilis]